MRSKKNSALVNEIYPILKPLAKEGDLAKRIEAISGQFIGCPYVVNSLCGGHDFPEQLVVKLDGFDCVTYMETVLALALAETVEQFKETLIRIRYKNSEVVWQKRNHYMVDWWRNNERQSLVQNLTRGSQAGEKTRELNLIKGLPKRRVTFRVF